jgi:uncharacterized membrane protein YedE/YeeE
VRILTAGLSGLLFAFGLALGGMTDAGNVVGFLDVAGDWRPGLAFVMAGALAVFSVGRLVVLRRGKPMYAARFPLTRTGLDRPLVLGSALFGLGWGLAGYCPGPALVSLASSGDAALFVAAMLGGLWLGGRRVAATTPAVVEVAAPQAADARVDGCS